MTLLEHLIDFLAEYCSGIIPSDPFLPPGYQKPKPPDESILRRIREMKL